MLTFNNIDDIWEEVFRRVDQVADDTKFSLGQNLWVELGFYCSPNMLVSDEIMMLVQEVAYCMKWNMAPFNNLDEADSVKLRYMTAIRDEIEAAQNYKAQREVKNG